MPNSFVKLPAMEEASRRKLLFEGMSFRRYDFWRWHGISPAMAIVLACSDFETPDIYTQKQGTDTSSHAGFATIIGLGDVQS